jgi:hypothetical protein
LRHKVTIEPYDGSPIDGAQAPRTVYD